MNKRQKSKNPFRTVSKICEKCGKNYKEKENPVTITETSNVDENGVTTRHEEEFVPYCQKCFKKELQRYKKVQWLTEMLRAKFINQDVLEKYKNNELSNQELDNLWREYLKCQ